MNKLRVCAYNHIFFVITVRDIILEFMYIDRCIILVRYQQYKVQLTINNSKQNIY